MQGRQAFAGQHRALCRPGRAVASQQNAREETVKAFVVARGHRVARGADIEVMHPQMFAAEMAVENAGQQEIAHPAFKRGFLVHQLVAVVDADGAGHDAHAEEQHDPFAGAQVAGLRHIPQEPAQQGELHRKPDQRDGAIPFQAGLGGVGIGVVGVQAQNRVQK